MPTNKQWEQPGEKSKKTPLQTGSKVERVAVHTCLDDDAARLEVEHEGDHGNVGRIDDLRAVRKHLCPVLWGGVQDINVTADAAAIARVNLFGKTTARSYIF